MAASRANVPVVVVCGIVCLAGGAAAGVLGMAAFGYHWTPEKKEAGGPPGGPPGMGGGPPGMGGGPPGRGGPGRPDMPGMPNFGQPDIKGQLAQFVAALDRLTGKLPTVTLSDTQKAKVLAQLKGLSDMKTLSDEEAGTRLQELSETLKGQKEALEEAGFTPPGPGGVPNPFQEEVNKKHLQRVEKQLAKPAT